MGGHNLQHTLARDIPAIDAGMLHRAGAIRAGRATTKPGIFGFHTYGRDVLIIAHGAAQAPAAQPVVLVSILELPRNWRCFAQAVRLSETPCHYGGKRQWLHCPGCGCRRFRLFYHPGLTDGGKPVHTVLCRECLNLTYTHRRSRGRWRVMARERTVFRRVGAWAQTHGRNVTGLTGLRMDFPHKPAHMRWSTYGALFAEWETRFMETEGALTVAAMRSVRAVLGAEGIAAFSASLAELMR